MEPDLSKYIAFRNALSYSLEKSLQNFTQTDFLKCITYTTKEDKDILKSYYNKAVKVLRESLPIEYDVICEERKVAELLAEMEELIQKQPSLNSGQRCPLPSDISPIDICRANIYAKRLEEKEKLKEELQKPEAELAAIYKDTDQLQDTYDAVVGDVMKLLDVARCSSMCSQLSTATTKI